MTFMARLSIFGRSENRLRPVWQASVPDHTIGLSWAPDGTRLAAAAVSGPIVIFDTNTGKPLYQLAGHGFGTTEIAWQPAGTNRNAGVLLASVGQDSQVRLWDAASGRQVQALDGGAKWAEKKVLWHPSGQWLATATGKIARVWAVTGDRAELIRELPPQASTVTDIKWRPGTNHLTLLAYGAAATYDPLQGEESVKVLAWKGSPLVMAWSPDGKILAHGNQDATVHFWYYDASRDLQMSGYRTKVRELAWDFTSRYLATGGGPVVCVWDCQAGPSGPENSKPLMLVGHEESASVTALAYQSRGFLLASAGLDGRVILWQPTSRRGSQVGDSQFEGGEASVLAWSPDDTRLAAGSGAGAVALFRAG
jgi:WD40 repeat protein